MELPDLQLELQHHRLWFRFKENLMKEPADIPAEVGGAGPGPDLRALQARPGNAAADLLGEPNI